MNHCRKIKCHTNCYCLDRKIDHCHYSLPLSPLRDRFLRQSPEAPRPHVNKPSTCPARKDSPSACAVGPPPQAGRAAGGSTGGPLTWRDKQTHQQAAGAGAGGCGGCCWALLLAGHGGRGTGSLGSTAGAGKVRGKDGCASRCCPAVTEPGGIPAAP